MKVTREQAAIIGVYTGILCGPFSDMHALAEKLLGRAVFTHEFAVKSVNTELRKRAKPLFLSICATDEDSNERP